MIRSMRESLEAFRSKCVSYQHERENLVEIATNLERAISEFENQPIPDRVNLSEFESLKAEFEKIKKEMGPYLFPKTLGGRSNGG